MIKDKISTNIIGLPKFGYLSYSIRDKNRGKCKSSTPHTNSAANKCLFFIFIFEEKGKQISLIPIFLINDLLHGG